MGKHDDLTGIMAYRQSPGQAAPAMAYENVTGPGGPAENRQRERRRLGLWLFLAALAWSALLGASLLWAEAKARQSSMELARNDARANFNKDWAFRAWGTSHGGVYVPVSDHTPPNPYLRHIDYRDIEAPDGRALTLMNPAYMVRQMMERFGEEYGIQGRITSLKPLNPANAPDAWERNALLAFERGAAEVFEVSDDAGGARLRLMRPLMTEEGCLKCHAHQGYSIGDVRGGIGISVALAPYLSHAAEEITQDRATHGVLWMLGLAALGLAGLRGSQRINEREQLQARIWHQANFDGLTGLANRNLFLDRLQQAVKRAAHGHASLALLFIDLDHFKDVNDSRGHSVGDTVLQHSAARLRSVVAGEGTACRIGGDEFGVICDGDSELASGLARRIVQVFDRAFELPDGAGARVTASIGIATYPADGDDAGALLRCADTAMYQAKADGRSAFRFFDPSQSEAVERRLRLEQDLRRALAREEFVLHYQPVFALPGRSLIGVEALLRWNHPEHGLVGPDRFVDIAEHSGLILPLGAWVLRAALRQLRDWDSRGMAPKSLMINVSTRQCRAADFPGTLAALVTEFGPDLIGRVALEITESLYLGDAGRARALLRHVRDLGFRVLIDDFGTGYSALAYLRDFPVDGLKIDRDFVRHIADRTQDAMLCKTFVDLAHGLGMGVVAEGVETEAQLRILSEQGCDRAQGFLLGRPVPADALAGDMLRSLR